MYVDKEALELKLNFSEGTSMCHLWYKPNPYIQPQKGW